MYVVFTCMQNNDQINSRQKIWVHVLNIFLELEVNRQKWSQDNVDNKHVICTSIYASFYPEKPKWTPIHVYPNDMFSLVFHAEK